MKRHVTNKTEIGEEEEGAARGRELWAKVSASDRAKIEGLQAALKSATSDDQAAASTALVECLDELMSAPTRNTTPGRGEASQSSAPAPRRSERKRPVGKTPQTEHHAGKE